MKIILSRKGFDSSIGKVPSPILPGGQLRSLSIPESDHDCAAPSYAQIKTGQASLGQLVNELSKGKIPPSTAVHLDPDLDAESKPRRAGWKPLFGQASAAEGHLQKCGVQAGDLFLFYGWFRQTEVENGAYQYVRDAPDLHVIFGWLQIEQRLSVAQRSAIPEWALDHAHCLRRQPHRLDALYIATDKLRLPQCTTDLPGSGCFKQFSRLRCLTAEGTTKRSIWRLPGWFDPAGKPSGLSYHHTARRWTQVGDDVHLQSVGRGQEFVLDCADYPEAFAWLNEIFGEK
ncbi:hypothetical protein BH10CHL1_BH10CHL1_14130 [soil metagenome]